MLCGCGGGGSGDTSLRSLAVSLDSSTIGGIGLSLFSALSGISLPINDRTRVDTLEGKPQFHYVLDSENKIRGMSLTLGNETTFELSSQSTSLALVMQTIGFLGDNLQENLERVTLVKNSISFQTLDNFLRTFLPGGDIGSLVGDGNFEALLQTCIEENMPTRSPSRARVNGIDVRWLNTASIAPDSRIDQLPFVYRSARRAAVNRNGDVVEGFNINQFVLRGGVPISIPSIITGEGGYVEDDPAKDLTDGTILPLSFSTYQGVSEVVYATYSPFGNATLNQTVPAYFPTFDSMFPAIKTLWMYIVAPAFGPLLALAGVLNSFKNVAEWVDVAFSSIEFNSAVTDLAGASTVGNKSKAARRLIAYSVGVILAAGALVAALATLLGVSVPILVFALTLLGASLFGANLSGFIGSLNSIPQKTLHRLPVGSGTVVVK